MDRPIELLVFLILLAVALPEIADTAQKAIPALVLALVILLLARSPA